MTVFTIFETVLLVGKFTPQKLQIAFWRFVFLFLSSLYLSNASSLSVFPGNFPFEIFTSASEGGPKAPLCGDRQYLTGGYIGQSTSRKFKR